MALCVSIPTGQIKQGFESIGQECRIASWRASSPEVHNLLRRLVRVLVALFNSEHLGPLSLQGIAFISPKLGAMTTITAHGLRYSLEQMRRELVRMFFPGTQFSCMMIFM